jgi:hypothetical protein
MHQKLHDKFALSGIPNVLLSFGKWTVRAFCGECLRKSPNRAISCGVCNYAG